MSNENGTGSLNVPDHFSLEQGLSEAAGDADDLGSARLKYVLDSKGSLSLRQSAFDCLEVWEDHPSHLEPLYAAALLFLENNDVDLALLAAEFAMSIVARPSTSIRWPFHTESNGWQLELLYAQILVRKDRVEDAMAYYGSVLSSCDDSARHTITEEVVLVSRRLPLCEIVGS